MAKVTSKGRTSQLDSAGMGGKKAGPGANVAGRGSASPSGKVGGAKGRMSTLGSNGMGAAKAGKSVGNSDMFVGGGKVIGKTVTSKGKVPTPPGTLHWDGKGN